MSLVETINKQFQTLSCDWIIAEKRNDGRIALVVPMDKRQEIEKDKANRKPTVPIDQVKKIATYCEQVVRENKATVWFSAGADTEIAFQSNGTVNVHVYDESTTDSSSAASSSNAATAPSSGKPMIRYWACRGRCESLRLMLADQLGLDGFTEDVIEFTQAAEWKSTLKPDTSFSGPFHQLPVVQWNSNDSVVGETEACARYFATYLGIDGYGDVGKRALADSVTCAIYQNVTQTVLKPLYAENKEAFIKEIEALKTKYTAFLPNIEAILGDKSFLHSDQTPLYSDYFLIDALEQINTVMGETYLPKHFEKLNEYRKRFLQRPNIQAYQKSKSYDKWVYSPNEKDNWGFIKEWQQQQQ